MIEGTGAHDTSPSAQFESQFSQMKTHQTENGTYTTVRVTPENPRGNTVVYATGWTSQMKNCKPFFREFFRRRKDVRSIQYPSYAPPEVPEGSIYNPYALRNADAFIDAIKREGIEKIDLVGDSEGSSTVLTIANRLKEEGQIQVGNIVLVSPSGLGKPPILELATGIVKMLGQEASGTLGSLKRAL